MYLITNKFKNPRPSNPFPQTEKTPMPTYLRTKTPKTLTLAQQVGNQVKNPDLTVLKQDLISKLQPQSNDNDPAAILLKLTAPVTRMTGVVAITAC